MVSQSEQKSNLSLKVRNMKLGIEDVPSKKKKKILKLFELEAYLTC